jgi:predicted NBD/HSP70 family sugar kinase
MEQYVALDVSLQKIAVCVLNASGRVVIEAEVASEPGDWSLMIDGMCAARTC